VHAVTTRPYGMRDIRRMMMNVVEGRVSHVLTSTKHRPTKTVMFADERSLTPHLYSWRPTAHCRFPFICHSIHATAAVATEVVPTLCLLERGATAVILNRP